MFPTPWTVDILAYLGDVEDDFGNEKPKWSTVARTEPVYGWAPAGTSEANVSRHAASADVELYAPPSFAANPRDRVVLDGNMHEVEGYVEDFNHGPFGWRPGVRLNLRRLA